MSTSFQAFHDEIHELALLPDEHTAHRIPAPPPRQTSVRRLLFGCGITALGLAVAVAPLI